MTESYVIIGDGIAGSSAAETIREEKPDADIAVITDEGEALYNRILIKEFAKENFRKRRSPFTNPTGTTSATSTSN